MERYKVYQFKDHASATFQYDIQLSNGLNVLLNVSTYVQSPTNLNVAPPNYESNQSSKLVIYDSDKNNITSHVLNKFYAQSSIAPLKTNQLGSDLKVWRAFIEFCKKIDINSLQSPSSSM